jgi:capsular polysaccharide export protein
MSSVLSDPCEALWLPRRHVPETDAASPGDDAGFAADSPLLRPPPWIARRLTAPFATPCAAGESHARDPDRIDTVIESLCSARVGGCFWGDRPTVPAASLLLHPNAAMPPAASQGQDGAVRLPPGPLDPWHLLEQARAVIAPPGDPLSILARLTGVPHSVDLAIAPCVLSVDARRALAWRVLTAHVRYRDPFGGERLSVEAAIDLLAAWRRHGEATRGIAVQLGMRRWKRGQMDRFLRTAERSPPHASTTRRALGRAHAAGGAIAAWPSRVPETLGRHAAEKGVAVVHVEDGFLRSPGLGVHLVPPLSLTIDRRGLHYDPARPSDLETLLASHAFPPALLARAARLRAAIVAAGIGKYGRNEAPLPLMLHPERPVVLVIGQVADDRSVRLGDVATLGNAGLIERARAEAPDAILLYRPHPDVIAGHRAGGVPARVLHLADHVLDRPCALAPLLARADAVHVLTSLTGFEALLRERPVVCHGAPFYAGWGLTEDRVVLPRRGRRLSLDALVAASLLLYPLYLDPATGLPCTAERIVAHLALARPARSPQVLLRRLEGAVRALARRAA